MGVTDVDDVPAEVMKLDFEFPFFGGRYTSMAVSPNGYLQARDCRWARHPPAVSPVFAC